MKRLIGEAEELRQDIITDLGLEPQGITRVYLASSLQVYQALQPGWTTKEWSRAVAYPKRNLIIILSPRAVKRGALDLSTIFKHEFTHIALGRAFQGTGVIPHWLHEGIAMFESKEWDFRRISTIMRAVLTDTLIPLSEITQSFPQDGRRAELAYCQSFYLISFLINEYGRLQFHRFIKEYSGGSPLDQALMDIYDLDLDQLEERWKQHLKLKFSWIPVITSATALWFGLAILFLLAYAKKRKARRQLYEQWDKEESHKG
ncbi:MAG: peptidase MA family metallohydrolase [Thermodesulfobacteriota bacterium]